MSLGSLVWDASATMIDVRSVWTAWFQFWGKQHHLHIDVLFFCNILNVQHRIELDRQKKKSIQMQRHLVIVGQAAWPTPKIQMQRFAFLMSPSSLWHQQNNMERKDCSFAYHATYSSQDMYFPNPQWLWE